MEDEVMIGTNRGDFIVRESEKLRLSRGAVLQGTIEVKGRLRIDAGATIQGGLTVAPGGALEVAGVHMGPLDVAEGGSVMVEQFGKLRGPLENYGDVQIFGSFGGPLRGNEPTFHPGSRVLEPEVRDGQTIYNG